MLNKKKLFLNTTVGVTKQIIAVTCGLVLPRCMLLYYGSAINGLISSITHFLSFISLLDMGVGAVIQSNLYKPMVDKDLEQISRIIKASERFFRRLSYIFVAYIILLCFVFVKILDTEYSEVFTISLLFIISISTFAQYFFGMPYQLLLNADQRAYVPLLMQIGTTALSTILALTLIKWGASVHVVKLMTAFVYALRPLGQSIYVHKNYDLDRKIEVIGEPIKQKWNGFSQHLSAVVCENVDVAVLTAFSSFETVSIYSIYHSIINGLTGFIMMASTGLEPLLGNMIAKKKREQLIETFNFVEWIIHTSVTITFTIAALLIIPFVSVYTNGIQDTNYIVPLFGYLLIGAYAVRCLRIPYFCVINAAGHFKETQNGSFVAAILNIIITVLLVFRYGLIGAAMGTLVAMVYHTCYFAWYLRINILQRPFKYFCGHIFVDLLAVVITCIVTKNFTFDEMSYLAWTSLAVKVTLTVFLINIIVNLTFYLRRIMRIFRLLIRHT